VQPSRITLPADVPTRLGAFALVLALSVAGGWFLGHSVGPLRLTSGTEPAHLEHEVPDAAGQATAGGYDTPDTGGTDRGDVVGQAPTGDLVLWAVQAGPLGKVVTDGDKHVLYRSDRDSNAPPVSRCTGGCTDTWEPVIANLDKVPTLLGVNEDLVDVIIRDDGRPQLTLGGWPLYRRVGDDGGGVATESNGVDGVWFAIRPDGERAGPTGPVPAPGG
jgi:predicted lipoprotein with Yx(FWY)xxD motif